MPEAHGQRFTRERAGVPNRVTIEGARRAGPGASSGAQPRKNDGDEPTHGGLRSPAGGCSKRVKAVGCEFIGRNIITYVAGRGSLNQQVTDELFEVLLGSGDVLATVQERRHLCPVPLLQDLRKGLEHRLQPFTRAVVSIANLSKIFQVGANLPLVPSDEDRPNVGKVLVERGTPDASFLGYPRHRDRREAMLRHQRRGRVEYRIAHGAPMRIDRFGPQLWHYRRIRDAMRLSR
jgi:hypothetical protein